MNNAAKITCRRCGGKGNRHTHVVYCGVPGTCFACRRAGEVYKDKFYRAFGVDKKFYGVTRSVFWNEGNCNNGVFKLLSTEPELSFTQFDHRGTRGRIECITECVELTEAQARKFWARYGSTTVLGGVRVAEFNGQRA